MVLLYQTDKSIGAPAIITWERGNHSVRVVRYRYRFFFDGDEELHEHSTAPDEWHNLADDSKYPLIRSHSNNQLPDQEASVVKQGMTLWNVINADVP